MKKSQIIGVLILSVLVTGIVFGGEFTKEKISGPYRHENLEIFLLRDDTVKRSNRKYLALEKAIEKEIVIVHETGNVQELSIENTSGDVYVFINSGSIVKGGKQDRVIRYDMVLEHKSGKVPLASFCVESGRWQQRKGENVGKFSSSKQMVSSKALKIAAKHIENQSEVWNKVAKQQNKLNTKLRERTGKDNLNVRASQSSSSLQLTLENKDLEKQVQEYQAALEKVLDGKNDVVGFAFAINGEINNADVYNDPDLFKTLWPKLLKSAIVEALSEYEKDRIKTATVKIEAVEDMLNKPKKLGKATVKEVNKNTDFKSIENEDYLMFETNDKEKKQWIHRNYIKKDPQEKNMQTQKENQSINQNMDMRDLQRIEVQQRQIRK